MHPILMSRTRIVVYLAAWVFIAVLLKAVVLRGSEMRWAETTAIATPMCLLYAFVCLTSWYLCQSLPLRDSSIGRLIGTHVAAAGIASAFWVGLGEGWSMVLDTSSYFNGAADRYAGQRPILFLSGALLFLLAVAFNYLLITFEISQQAETRSLELQVLAREAELKVLRAQIDPHFLFNSLNSINALITVDPVAARRMCVLLADFLRGGLKLGSEERIPFREEMKLTEHYLDIERVRLGSRLTIERDIDAECDGCLVPPLILQPLIENAVTHGVAPMIEGGTLRIEAHRYGDLLRIVLENPFEADNASKNGAGLGMKNVQMRLSNLFNGEARFTTLQVDGRFRVELQLPCEES